MALYYLIFAVYTVLTPINTVYFYKKYQLSAGTTLRANTVYMIINGTVSAVIPLLIMVVKGDSLRITTYSIIMATAIVISSAINGVSLFKAFERGKIATASILGTIGSIVLSCLWGVVILNEELSLQRGIAILIMLTASVLISEKSKTEKKQNPWILYILIMVSAAATMILSKQHQVEVRYNTVDVMSFSVWVGIVRVIVFLLFIPFVLKEKKNTDRRNTKTVVKYALLSSIVSAGCYMISLTTNKVLPIVVTTPLSTGFGIVLNVVLPFIFFSEKLDKKQILGAGLSFAGVITFLLG